MKNEEYQKEYNYGYKIGLYQSGVERCSDIFKDIFLKEHKKEKKRIKWLSNYEVELLLNKMIEYIKCEYKESYEDRKIDMKKIRAEILKLLR